MFPVTEIKPYKCDIVNKWSVTADLRGLESFENCDSNYDVIDRLKDNKVLTKSCEEDSEYCQSWFHFNSKSAAESFIKRLAKYVEVRKKLISSL